MKPPSFYPISVSAHPGQLKAPLSVNIIALPELIRLLVQRRSWYPVAISVSGENVLCSGISSRSTVRSCWLPWLLENPLRNDLCTALHPSSLRDAFSRQIGAGTPLQERKWHRGEVALISIGRKQQGTASQHCLGLRLKYLFLSLVFLALHF